MTQALASILTDTDTDTDTNTAINLHRMPHHQQQQPPVGIAAESGKSPSEPRFSDPANPERRLAAKDLFGRHFRGGLIVAPYDIKTRSIRQFYKRDFVYLSVLMNALDNYRNIRGVDHALLDHAETQIADCLNVTQGALARAGEHARALVADQGAAGLPIRYPLGVKLDVPIISPSARGYMEVLAAADNALAAIETCWLLGFIDTRTRKVQEGALRHSIRLVSTVVRRCRNDMAAHVRSLWPEADGNTALVHVVTNPEALTGGPDSSAPGTTAFRQMPNAA